MGNQDAIQSQRLNTVSGGTVLNLIGQWRVRWVRLSSGILEALHCLVFRYFTQLFKPPVMT